MTPAPYSTDNVQTSVLYGPYGTTRYTNGTMPGSYGYTGQHADATTGLDYYNARYYDASAGQFASADTARDGLNRYGYVHGNPTTANDPSGHMACDTDGSHCGGVDDTPSAGGGNPPGGGDFSVTNHPCGGNWTAKQCQEGRSSRLAAASGWLAAAHFAEALMAGVNLYIDYKRFQADKESDGLKAVGDIIAVLGDILAILSAVLSGLAALHVDVLGIQKWVDTVASTVNFVAGLYRTLVAGMGFWLVAASRILISTAIDAFEVVFGGANLTLSMVVEIAGGALKKINPGWDLDLVGDAARAFSQTIISGAYAVYEFTMDGSDGDWCNHHKTDCMA